MAAVTRGAILKSIFIEDDYIMKDDCLCITQEMRHKILDECHAPPYAGHRGLAATTQTLEKYFYWPRMQKHNMWHNALFGKRLNMTGTRHLAYLFHSLCPTHHGRVLQDFIFYLPRTRYGNDGILTIIVTFTKQAHLLHSERQYRQITWQKYLWHMFKHHCYAQAEMTWPRIHWWAFYLVD